MIFHLTNYFCRPFKKIKRFTLKQRFKILSTILLICITVLGSQGQNTSAFRPQLWNNLFVGWNIDDKFTLRGDVAFNILLSNEIPWYEITSSVSGVYHFHPFMELTTGLYLARAQQSKDLWSSELRPYIGFRIHTNDSKRWMIANLSRFEIRAFRYSDLDRDIAFRFRNRTYGIVALNQPSILDDRNVYLFAYFEAFFNFGQEVRERFFNQFKYKIGFAYRHNFSWRVNIGVIYQDAINNVEQPAQLPVTVNTRWVLDWGIVYIIPAKKK